MFHKYCTQYHIVFFTFYYIKTTQHNSTDYLQTQYGIVNIFFFFLLEQFFFFF